ncbi:hypothetical protein VNO78_27547 [Psophocarpus tetragonolobus]|uniref:Uncharacterized protein n=1 Tax=Psophocarpus tetragonolobus TaxID=3891 RepID=A0AAN9XCD4_PSOTE
MEGTKGDEAAVTVGTTGTISLLMTRELDQMSSIPHQEVSSTSKPRISISSGSTSSTSKQPQPRKSFEASSSRSSNIINHMSPGIGLKTKLNGKHTHQIPMLGSHSLPMEISPVTKKKDKKKKSKIVVVVDIKCGYVDKTWATPITNSLKKLGFSKLSEKKDSASFRNLQSATLGGPSAICVVQSLTGLKTVDLFPNQKDEWKWGRGQFSVAKAYHILRTASDRDGGQMVDN